MSELVSTTPSGDHPSDPKPDEGNAKLTHSIKSNILRDDNHLSPVIYRTTLQPMQANGPPGRLIC